MIYKVIAILVILAVLYSQKHKNDEIPEGEKKKRNPFLFALAVIMVIFVIFLAIGIVFFFKMFVTSNTHDINKYEETYAEFSMGGIEFFPEHIPDNASNITFAADHGIQDMEHSFTLKCTLPSEDIEQYKMDYDYMKAEEPNYADFSIKLRNFVGYKSNNEKSNIDHDRYELFAGKGDCQGCGFVVDNENNIIYFFYDEYWCDCKEKIKDND